MMIDHLTAEVTMIAFIHRHKPTKYRPIQTWYAYDEGGGALGYAYDLAKLSDNLVERGYTIHGKHCCFNT